MNKYVFAFVFLFFCGHCISQSRQRPILISFFNESTAIPYTQFLTKPIHPGIQIGTDFNYNLKTRTRLYQTINACYFYHNYLTQGIGLKTDFGFEYRNNWGFAFDIQAGVGYMRTYATTDEYDFNNGRYEVRRDQGNSRLYPSISLGCSYYFRKSETTSPKVFISYQSWAEYPYSPDFIPILTHINLHIGFQFFLHSSRNS